MEQKHEEYCDCMACETYRMHQQEVQDGVTRTNIIGWLFFAIVMAAVLLFLSKWAGAQEININNNMAIVRIAESQIGKGEIGGNNKGPIVEMYTKGKDVAWCAGFVSWCRSKAGQRGHYFLSARAYWTFYHSARVARPRPGDIICFNRGRYQGHVGIVEKVQGQSIVTIQGNVGKYPAKVKRITYKLGHIKHLLGFVRTT